MNITTIHNEAKRGCGYRKQGGLYMMAGKVMAPCGKLPLELSVCPCCHAGIKPARGWTWIDPRPLFAEKPCDGPKSGADQACYCILDAASLPERMGLLWIGEKFYPTPDDFMEEAQIQGVSRRITAVPKDFVVGKTHVAFAHRKGIVKYCAHPDVERTGDMLTDEQVASCPDCHGEGHIYLQAIVGVFHPTRIEYIVKDGDSEEKLESMEKRGISLVRLSWDKGTGPEEDGEQELPLEDDGQPDEQKENEDFAQDVEQQAPASEIL